MKNDVIKSKNLGGGYKFNALNGLKVIAMLERLGFVKKSV